MTTDTNEQILTHSRMQCFKTCNRMHELRYEIGLRRQRTSDPLTRGTAYHKALEAYDKAEGDHEAKKREGFRAIELSYLEPPSWCVDPSDIHHWMCQKHLVSVVFGLHADYWQQDNIEVVATEKTFNLQLINPASGQPSRTWRSGGKIDRIDRLPDARLAVQEYKTTTQPIDVDADYWKRLRIDSQISTYVLAARGLDHPIDTVLYDVTRWPALRPYKATPIENRKYTKDGHLYAKQHEVNEDPADFGRRVYNEVVSNPTRYFQRQEIVRLESDLREHQHDEWAQAKQIRACQLSGVWPRNTGSCIGHYGKCDYFDICTGDQYEAVKSGIVPDGYRIANTMHEELTESDTA